jgi:hypothetical protein
MTITFKKLVNVLAAIYHEKSNTAKAKFHTFLKIKKAAFKTAFLLKTIFKKLPHNYSIDRLLAIM